MRAISKIKQHSIMKTVFASSLRRIPIPVVIAVMMATVILWRIVIGMAAAPARIHNLPNEVYSEELSLMPCASMAQYVATAHPSVQNTTESHALPGVVLVTGSAGFIGHHLVRRLLVEGYAIIGLDELLADDDTASSVQLSRLSCQGFQLSPAERRLHRAYKSSSAPRRACFIRGSVNSPGVIERLISTFGVTHIVHLAGQAGVRKSVSAPESYLRNNIEGTFSVLNAARHLSASSDAAALSGRYSVTESATRVNAAAAQIGVPPPPWSGRGTVEHVVYASSSSVYGELPPGAAAASESALCADQPVSIYAASKRSTELIASSYAAMFHLPSTALRFFTVYGQHGRPDMAVWKFTDAVLSGRTIALTAKASFQRDFTHISDIIDGVVCVMRRPPVLTRLRGGDARDDRRPHATYNIGRADPVTMDELIRLIEGAVGSKAVVQRHEALSVDVTATHADVSQLASLCGRSPAMPLRQGIESFVRWYKEYAAGKPSCGEGWPQES